MIVILFFEVKIGGQNFCLQNIIISQEAIKYEMLLCSLAS